MPALSRSPSASLQGYWSLDGTSRSRPSDGNDQQGTGGNPQVK
jgi:hypothetical protein